MPECQEEPSGSFFVAPASDDVRGWVAHCDGGAWPNPGTMAVGVVLTSPTGVVRQVSERLAGSGCNNEAEWQAAVRALRCALDLGARILLLHTDSTQVRDHLVRPDAPALPPALQIWADEARELAARLSALTVQWVPRHRNASADALARQALGLPPKPVSIPHPKARRRR